jgi:D-3-phosphoglycerate dehydrogenase
VKVAITDLFPPNWHPAAAAAAPPGWTYELAPEQSLETRMAMVRDADVVFCGSATPNDEMLEAAVRLCFVQKLGAGFDNLNVELCKAKGVGVARLAGNNAVAVAEHTLALLLAVFRGVVDNDRWVREGGWGKQRARASNRELRGKTIGIVGLGRIGREVAKRVGAFDTEILYYDVRRAEPEVERALGARFVELEELLAVADVVTLHSPASVDTQQMIDARRIAQMKPGAVLVNCGRGDLVDEAALVDALERGHLGGAGLDCVAQERPGGGDPYKHMSNVVLTPHVAGVSMENFATMMQRAFANAQRYVTGEPLSAEDVVWVPERRELPA